MRKQITYLATLSAALFITACSSTTLEVNSPEWVNWVESKVQISDAEGHGPDLGEGEWCNAVESKLFNRKSGLEPCSVEWGQKVTETLEQ